MSIFDEAKRQQLAIKLERLNSNFNEPEFEAVYKEFKTLQNLVLFHEIEVWLLQLVEKEIFIAWGILAGLYFEIRDFPNAKEFAFRANEKFPNTKIWENIMEGSIWEEFEDFWNNNPSD